MRQAGSYLEPAPRAARKAGDLRPGRLEQG